MHQAPAWSCQGWYTCTNRGCQSYGAVIVRALLLVASILLFSAPLAAQSSRDSAIVRAIRTDLDSIARDRSAPQYSKRAQTRLRARADSLLVAPAEPAPHDSSVVVVTPPVDSTPAPGPVPADTARFDGIAELPRNIPTVVLPSCATITRVSADLQAAINAAAPGACLYLRPGATFVGNFTLPNTGAGSSWVTIQTDTVLPQPGVRMTPAQAAALRLAKILSPNYTAAIGTAAGAHHYVIRGVEIGTTPAAEATGMNQLVRFTDPSATWSLAGIPTNLWLAQVYAHGTPTLDLRRIVRADFRVGGVVDSWLDEAHSNNSDSQCGLWLSGARNQRWQNNYCAGGHEPLMAGGGDPPDSTLQPSDIAIIRNHLGRPASWKGVWQVKNLVETKNVRRLLLEGNVLENSWLDAQDGSCVVMKGENQDGTAPWSTTADVTIRYNRFVKCASGIRISGRGTNGNVVANATARLSIHDNLQDSMAVYGGEAIPFTMLGDVTDLVLRANTATNGLEGIGSTAGMKFDGAPLVRFVADSNVIGHGSYGIKGSGCADGIPTLTCFAPGARVTNNAIVATDGNCGTYPATNTCPRFMPAVGGATLSKVTAATAGVVVRDPSFSARRAAARARPRLKYPHPTPKPACQTGTATCDVPLKLR